MLVPFSRRILPVTAALLIPQFTLVATSITSPYTTGIFGDMAWRSHGANNEDLVNTLARNGVVNSGRVKNAMLRVDRGDFVLDRSDAYYDSPQPIGHAATISAPHMHAHILELLEGHLKPGARALDVGSGSGYLLAVMAEMVKPGGKVFGIEHIPELVEFSVKNLRKHNGALLEDGTIHVQVADGFNGLPEQAPFNAIHVGAAAPEIPQALIDQLAPGGRLVIPVGKYMQELLQVDKLADGTVRKTPLMGFMYVPLPSREQQEKNARWHL